MADKAQTWVYTEDYVAESDALTAARAVASELGAAPVSPGTGAALRMLAAVAGAPSSRWGRAPECLACGSWTAWRPTAC